MLGLWKRGPRESDEILRRARPFPVSDTYVVDGHLCPAVHCVHVTCNDREYDPVEQGAFMDGSAVSGHSYPAGHAIHTVCPALLIYPVYKKT